MLSAHPQSPHLHPPPPPPPSKASLKTWWNHFTFVQRAKKEPTFVREYEKGSSADHPVFGKPLLESLKYASVPISTANQNGDLYVWGYVPVVVAKCGLYLKENATEVPGTFRVNGANRRMRELQQQFEASPKYGKNLDWKQETYTTHDVASVFRRYLTQMPEPVIPHRLYHKFRDALAKEPYSADAVISEYKALIRQMSQAHQYLLLYVLDLLSVFARKSDKNLMTAQNLAVIFRPGILSHPTHEMAPAEHALSQRVLEFLIANQDWFMLDTPTPNPSLVSPPLSSSSNTTTPVIPPSITAFAASNNANNAMTTTTTTSHPNTTTSTAFIRRITSPPTTTTTPAIHWKSELGGNDMWKGAGLGVGIEEPMMMMSEKEIQREQERIKMIRRRTTLERGEGLYGTLEEPDMTGDSPVSTTFPHNHLPTSTTHTTSSVHGHIQTPSSSSSILINTTGAVGVTRSRTLPSSSKRRGSGGAGGSNPNVHVAAAAEKDREGGKENQTQGQHHRERSRLVKKQKRASMVTPSSTPAPGSSSQYQSAAAAPSSSNNPTNTTAAAATGVKRLSQIITGGSGGNGPSGA